MQERKVRADIGATAWLNASVASGQDDAKPALYRTLSVEFFRSGVQFIGCDGTALFRLWAPYSDIGGLPAPHPGWDEAPDDSIVVQDADKFALGFMRTLLSAVDDDAPEDLTLSVDPADDENAPALGAALQGHVLNLHALGQRLSCQLYDGAYPNWRAAQFGLHPAETVDGMTLAPRLFQAVGKLKGVTGVECSFRGEERAIDIRSVGDWLPSLRGLLMPMRRPSKVGAATNGDGQAEHDDGAEG